MFDEYQPTLCFCLASVPVGKPQGWFVLLLAPEAQINYLFTLMQLEADRERKTESVKKRKKQKKKGHCKKVRERNGGSAEKKDAKRKWMMDRGGFLYFKFPVGVLETREAAHKWGVTFLFTGEDRKSSVLFSLTAIMLWMSEA